MIVKQDTRDRIQVPASQRAALLAEFERSGLSGARFARLAGIRYSTFMGWIRRKRRAALAPVIAPRPRLVEAVAMAAPVPPVLRVELGGCAAIVLTDRSQVELAARLIKALQPPC